MFKLFGISVSDVNGVIAKEAKTFVPGQFLGWCNACK
jgi:hypothetical protein